VGGKIGGVPVGAAVGAAVGGAGVYGCLTVDKKRVSAAGPHTALLVSQDAAGLHAHTGPSTALLPLPSDRPGRRTRRVCTGGNELPGQGGGRGECARVYGYTGTL